MDENMNDVMIEVSSGVSEVSDLRSVSLSELPAGLSAGALAARVTSGTLAPAFAVSAFNSYI
jgi:hypothetical protein